jgi:transcriptional regulator with XRE-family HTH domain
MRPPSKTPELPDPENPGSMDPAAIAAIDRNVGIRLYERRTLLGLSQQDVAARIGLSFQQLQKYERGINRISASRLYQLAAVLKATVGDFFEGASMAPAPQFTQSTEVRELLTAFHALPTESQRRAFRQLLASMKDSDAD